MNPETELTKRGRGRPRKYPLPDPNAPKRGRGRPRKEQALEPVYQPAKPRRQRPQIQLGDWFARLRNDNFQKRLVAAGVIGLLLIIGFTKPLNLSISKASSDTAIITKVNGLTDTPKGETPQILRVVDQTKLNQPFLKDAKNGDKVLVYAQANKVILYRPSTNKVIAIGPLATQSVVSTAPVATPVSTTLRIGLYNGSNVAGITSTNEPKVSQALPGSTIVIKERAATNYAKTVVVDLSGQHSDEAQKLANMFGGTVGSLPAGEVTPQADILVIFGG
jgi:hypothetical protein